MFFQFSVPNVGRHAPVKEANIEMEQIGIYNHKPIYKGIVNSREVYFAYVIQYDRGQWQLLFGDPRENYTTKKILHIINSENVNIESKEYRAYVEFGGEVIVIIHL